MASLGKRYGDPVVAAARALATGEVNTHRAMTYAQNAPLDQWTFVVRGEGLGSMCHGTCNGRR